MSGQSDGRQPAEVPKIYRCRITRPSVDAADCSGRTGDEATEAMRSVFSCLLTHVFGGEFYFARSNLRLFGAGDVSPLNSAGLQ